MASLHSSLSKGLRSHLNMSLYGHNASLYQGGIPFPGGYLASLEAAIPRTLINSTVSLYKGLRVPFPGNGTALRASLNSHWAPSREQYSHSRSLL